MQIKIQLGKLTLRDDLSKDLSKIVRQQQDKNTVKLLPISFEHILELDRLPFHHKDPFDRLLMAQGRVESASIVSWDAAFAQYDCNVIW